MSTDPTLSPQAIISITARIHTAGNDPDDGTLGNVDNENGVVLLGVAGREFVLNRADITDFQQHTSHDYILGEGGNVKRPKWNDPRNPRLTLGDLHRHQPYLRFVPPPDVLDDDWHVERADVTVNGADGGTVSYVALAGEPTIWLGYESGLTLYLDRT
ncbi:hypothetical protein [Spongiactinospora sp. 9N601]|uniref:hypothetical protein n=1 Tax=Spongiactinospora sp. 9N601 TaxID=3375149 RepID=UPI00379A7924